MNKAKAAAVSFEGCTTEARRLRFLLERDGPAATLAWVRRTLAIYRRAVLDPAHFASSPEYRRRYLASCADFRRWLSLGDSGAWK